MNNINEDTITQEIFKLFDEKLSFKLTPVNRAAIINESANHLFNRWPTVSKFKAIQEGKDKLAFATKIYKIQFDKNDILKISEIKNIIETKGILTTEEYLKLYLRQYFKDKEVAFIFSQHQYITCQFFTTIYWPNYIVFKEDLTELNDLPEKYNVYKTAMVNHKVLDMAITPTLESIAKKIGASYDKYKGTMYFDSKYSFNKFVNAALVALLEKDLKTAGFEPIWTEAVRKPNSAFLKVNLPDLTKESNNEI